LTIRISNILYGNMRRRTYGLASNLWIHD